MMERTGNRVDVAGQPAAVLPNKTGVCAACGAAGMRQFYAVDNVPVHSCLLMDTREQALAYPRGNVRLGFCPHCGFIGNLAFDPAMNEYSQSYEETQGFSPRFNVFARELAGGLVERHGLRGKHVLEIGCGKGEFLALVCELGENSGTGIDPAYVPGRLASPAAPRLRFIQDLYTEQYSDLTADLLACRHTLEHIAPVREFLMTVRRNVERRPDTLVFFELPDVERVLRDFAFWDIYYEHCSYFSLGSLARLFRSCGFQVLDLARAFDDQYLLIEARLDPEGAATAPLLPGEDDLALMAGLVDQFTVAYERDRQQWQDRMREYRAMGERAVLWGGGSKAVAYLTTLQLGDEIEYVVDINPFKQGKYLAGTGHQVVAPEFLRQYRPDVVILMNAAYTGEVEAQLAALGVPARVVAL